MSDGRHDDEEIPEWVLTLGKKPLRILDRTSDDTLIEAMEERLAAVLRLYECEATAEGWRDLALKLALAHEPVLKIETPVDRQHAEGGAEPTMSGFIFRTAMASATKRLGSVTAAAEYVSKTFSDAPVSRTLRNMVTPSARQKAVDASGPRQWRRDRYEQRAAKALRNAARRIEHSQK